MNTVMPNQQRGVSFGGFLVGAFLLVVVGLSVLKLIPAYMEDAKIKNLFTAISNDPEMQKASPQEIRVSYEKRSSIDAIKSIKPSDIEIASNNGKPTLRASYTVKVPLGGNVSLLMEFNPSSAQ